MENTDGSNAMSFSCQEGKKEGRRNIAYITLSKIENKFNQ